MDKISQARISSPLLSGIVYSFGVMIIITFLVSFLLLLSGMKEQSLPLYSYFIHGIALFVGGFASGKRAGNRGWFHGGILGLFYCVIILLIAFLGFDSAFSLQTLLFIGLSFVFGAFGGAIGVNLSK